jgi:predicted ATPase/DNA-binding SARP family transcriptional activator/tRNA A-37 threonylcarbamoyl transferase component Bud32
MALDIRLLGTVETFRDGTRVDVKGLRQQTFLAYLALTPGSPRHLDGIVAALWPNDAPVEPRQTVHTYASRLRAILGADAIVARGGGYVLAVSPAEVDASRFETLIHQAADQTADPQRRLKSLEAALALWQGPALEGLVLDDWARGPAVRWSEMRASAEDERAEVLIDLERAADAVADLEAAAWRSPLRERTHSLLMTALNRSGRQAEALRSFHDYRRRLATDLGLDPGDEISLLERSIAGVECTRAPTGSSIGGAVRGWVRLEPIGEGAFAVVYRGTQQSVDREVAIKVIRAELANQPDFIRRFEAEAHLIARLEHPRIVPLYDYWSEPGSASLVMRLFPDGAIEDADAAHRFALNDVARIVGQLGEALEAAHRVGVVHRDVKPGNVFLDRDDNAYLGDFGIAFDPGGAGHDADFGSAGSPAYAAPEQVAGRPVGPFTDVYGLAMTAYFCLSGHHPFHDVRTRTELSRRGLSDSLPSVTVDRPDVPAGIDDVLRQATAQDPADRYPTVHEFVAAFMTAAMSGADVTARNLPHVSTSFIGRADELHAVRNLMEHVRLTTLTGAGGCGKTRLAITAATASIPQYPGGAWWVELAATSTDDQVANAVALALRIPLVGGADPVEQVENHLRQIGHALLVLDNAEHVLDAVARVAHAVLEGCPLVTLMITSREPLGIPGEHLWRTPSLAAEDAAALFRDRAHEGRGDVPLDDDLVRTICQRLDGMPLAIELAAARTRSLSLDRIVAELAHVFRVLTGGARTRVARQQTLLASITWSYDLLDDGEQTVLRRLSVFEAPFLLETAEAVTADENTLDRSNVLEIVCHLVDKSLVQFDPTTGRYRLLETVRQFCADRLDESHETESTRSRHAAFYGRFARGIGARMRGLVVPDDVWLELADLFSALRWAYLASPVDAYRICGMNRVARVAVGYLDEMNEQLDWLVTRDGREAPCEWAAAMVHLTQEAILILGRDDLDGRIPDPRSSIGVDDLDTQWWQLYAEGQAAIQSGGTSTLEAALTIANAKHDDTATLTASSELALNTAWCGRFDVAQSALATTTRHLERLGQPFTSDTAGSGHAAAMFISIRQGRLADAMAYASADRPDNAFLMFLSAIQIAWLGYAVNDVALVDTAARWVGRSLPPILRGLSGFVGLLRGLTISQPAELDTLRAWFDDMGETPICRSQVVVPMVSEYLARGELADARTVAADFRRTVDAFVDAPLHRALRHQIDAIIAYSERDQEACGAACRNLIGLASPYNFALLTIDGFELLSLSNTVSAEDAAILLGAVHTAREDAGYRGRWSSYATDTLDATNAAVENYATAFRHGTTMTLEHLVSFVGLHAH